MRIESAWWADGTLTLQTADQEAVRFARDFRAGDYTISRSRKKRSLDANAYCWVLMDKIAVATGVPREEVYREAIRHISGNSEMVCVQERGADMVRQCWERNGLGWQTETFPSKLPGCVNLLLYYGSSVYDSRQMTALINHVIEDCKALGIETLTPRELSAMMLEWGGDGAKLRSASV